MRHMLFWLLVVAGFVFLWGEAFVYIIHHLTKGLVLL